MYYFLTLLFLYKKDNKYDNKNTNKIQNTKYITKYKTIIKINITEWYFHIQLALIG